MLSWFKRDDVVRALASDKSARKTLDAFVHGDPCKALEQAGRWLSAIHESTALKLQRRYELVAMFDEATHPAQRGAVERFLALPADSAQVKPLWQIAYDFWKRLGDGYLACARQANQVQAVPAAMNTQWPRLAALGVRALRHQLKWVLLRYGATRNEIWGECGRFVTLAESVNAAAAPQALGVGADTSSSTYQEMLRLMLYWCAMPASLSPAEQDIAERLVLHVSSAGQCNEQPGASPDYFFDLDGVHPPRRWAKGASVSAATRYIEISGARSRLHALYTQANRSGQVPAELGLGGGVAPHELLRVLRHLWIGWAKAVPPRAAARQKIPESLHAAYGFDNVLSVLAGASATPVYEWMGEDTSVGGCGVVVPNGKGEQIRVGMLVTLRAAAQASWRVGVVRRVSEQHSRQHHLGIQVLSNSASAVPVRTATGVRQNRKHEYAILLNENPARGGMLHLLARRDLLGAREAVEATLGAPESPLMLEPGGSVECGDDFDWLQYKLTDNVN